MENKMVSEFKDRLAQAMELRDMRPIDLANATGIPKSCISQYTTGYAKAKSDRLYLIGKALNVSEAWLMGFDVSMKRSPLGRVYELTEDEYRLIEYVRRMNDMNQNMLLGLAKELSDRSQNDK